MTVRLDMKEGIKADMHTWFWEAADPLYKTLDRRYDKIAQVGSTNDIVGGYWKGTSAIGATELEDRENNGQLHLDLPQEGYTVYATIKDKSLKIEVPREMKRDWHKTSDFLRTAVKTTWPAAVEYSKEKIVATVYQKGGITGGDPIFDNDDADLGLTTYTTPDLTYDGRPFIARSGANHAAKDGNTYYNGTAITTGDDSAGVTFANAKTMWNLLTVTNAKKENGQPFDNSQGVKILCAKNLMPAWQQINESTLNPDNAQNANNPLKGLFVDIIGHEHITTSTASFMTRGKGVKVWFSAPKFNFWEENDPPTFWASVIIDYAICVQNFRDTFGNNVATA